MKFRTEMELAGSGQLDDHRFDALADALNEIDAADPAVSDTDLTGSLAQGWVIVAMVVEADDPPDAVRKTIATVRAAIQRIGDYTPGWERLTQSAALAVRPAASEPVSVAV